MGWFILKGLLYGTSYLGGVLQTEIGFWQWMVQPLSSLFDISMWLDYLIGMLLYVFSDEVVFAIFRQTLGKKICGISVCNVAGRKISPLDFLRRDFDVFFQTIWFYIPHFFQYKRVVNGRASSYDEGCIYQARPIRPMDCDKSTTIVFVLFVLSWAIFGFRREDTSDNSITIQQPFALLPQAVEPQSPMPPPTVFDSPPSLSDIDLPMSPPAVEPQPPTPPPEAFKPDLKPVSKSPQLPPATRRRIKPEYPKGARERGEEGDVTLELDISEMGAVDDVRIIKSCGFAELDQAAIEAVKKARFTPARRGSANVPSTARITLTFRLKD